MWKDWIRERLAARGYVIFNTKTAQNYAQDSLFTTNLDHFRRDPRFQAAYSRGILAAEGVNPHTEWRVHIALWVAQNALRVPGDFVECGVNAGFVSSAIMHHLDWERTGRRYYLVDRFEGPDLSQFSAAEIAAGRRGVAESAIESGGYVVDLRRVEANFAEWPSARIVQGTVPDVLAEVDAERIAFLHLDMNCAFPERKALEFFWERLSPGAAVLFDDYCYFGNGALTASIDAAVAAFGAQILSLPTGQGLIFR